MGQCSDERDCVWDTQREVIEPIIWQKHSRFYRTNDISAGGQYTPRLRVGFSGAVKRNRS
jgi:hypothetical protein